MSRLRAVDPFCPTRQLGCIQAAADGPSSNWLSASVLVTARDEEGHRMTEQELIDTLLLVLVAGHETKVNLIGNAVHASLTHPEQLELVRAGELSWNDVIEETLRWAPASPTFRSASPLKTSRSRAAPPSARARRSCRRSRPPGAIRSNTGTPPSSTKHDARAPNTSASGTESTAAWAHPWPVWKPRSPSRRSSTASPTWNSPCSQRRWHRQAASSSEA